MPFVAPNNFLKSIRPFIIEYICSSSYKYTSTDFVSKIITIKVVTIKETIVKRGFIVSHCLIFIIKKLLLFGSFFFFNTNTSLVCHLNEN